LSGDRKNLTAHLFRQPLSLGDDSKWKAYFKDGELVAEIEKDGICRFDVRLCERMRARSETNISSTAFLQSHQVARRNDALRGVEANIVHLRKVESWHSIRAR
jgi:hypothetical protein